MTSPEFIFFCLFTLHLWGRIFKKFPDLRVLAYTDNDNIIGRFSQQLRLTSELKPVFKSDGNLMGKTMFKSDGNLMGKTMFLAKDTTVSHIFDRARFLLQNDPNLQDIYQDFIPDMFSVEGIEVLGTPIDTDTYIKTYVTQNCLKIKKHDPLTDGFVHNQLMKFCMNTLTQYMSTNVTLPPISTVG